MTNPQPPDSPGLVTVGEYPTALEAEWARSVLASAGICCQIPDQSMATIFPFPGLVRVQVPSEKAGEAAALLEAMDFERGLFLREKTDDEPEGAAEGEALEPDEVEALDPHDLCPAPAGTPCPRCGSGETEPSSAPPYAAENAVTSFLKRLAGRGWMRCAACGHLFERGKGG